MNPQTQTTTKNTTRRRMRRTGRARCPQRAASDPSSSSLSSSMVNPSAPSASSAPSALKPETETKTETKEKRQRARPFQTLPEFAALDRDQLAYIHDILRTKTLEDAQREIWTELGLQSRLDLCTLHRYKHKVLFAESLDLVDDAATAATAIDQLNDLLAGRPTQLSATGLAVVQQRALAVANDPETKPSLFANLHRIFTYEERKAERDRTHAFRVEQAAALNTHRTALQSTRDRLADNRIALSTHRKLVDLEKLKLAQHRLALDTRKHEHREKVAAAKTPNPNLDEEARLRAEGFLEIGRQVAARRRAAQSTPVEDEVTSLHSQTSALPSTTAPCGADIPVCASEPPNPAKQIETTNQNATNHNRANQ